jgi:hypothetical protein
MHRCVEPEWLDELPAVDARAARSREDLRRVNRWMGNARFMTMQLKTLFAGQAPRRIIELGGGDGQFLLSVAKDLATWHNGSNRWQGICATILDRQSIVGLDTSSAFQEIGWHTDSLKRDVFDWLKESNGSWDVVIANLFLHHFGDKRLQELLQGLAGKTRVLLAVEPRRSRLALAFSRMTGLIGCNDVTRHDAPVSVRAGFAGRELSGLWPQDEGWSLTEQKAGLFSHLFVARRSLC